MKKRRGINYKNLAIVIIIILSIIFGIYKTIEYFHEKKLEQIRIEQENARIEKERLEKEAKLKALEEEKKRKEEEERKRKEEEARLAALREHIYYSKKNAKIYSDESLNEVLKYRIPFQTEVKVEEYIKNEAGEIIAYKIVNPEDNESLVYTYHKSLRKNKSDWIEIKYDGVDYEPYEKFTYAENPPVKVKGVYVTQSAAQNAAGLLDNLLELARTTEINAFVIDVKDDNDNLLFYSKTAEKFMPEANKRFAIKDMKEFVQKLKDEGIYLIARVVVFKSPKYAKIHQDKSLHYKQSGKIYSDGDGIYWASPYNEELWEYVVGVSEEAADYGFNEIQFDYVRFPATTKKTDTQLEFYNQNGRNKIQGIQEFLKFAHKRLKEKKVYITADVFGWVATSINDQNIGQHWEALSNVVDYMAPMVYPSHYGKHNFGYTYPDKHPYGVVKASVQDALDRDKNIETPAKMRPWIQDFTASYLRRILGEGSYIKYGPQQIKDQVRALNDIGVDEFMLWNASNYYTKGGLKPKE